MKVLAILGTRPEAIKFAPLIKALQADASFDLKVCVTGQHQEMLFQVLDFFGISADYDLKLMTHNQTLFDLGANCLLALRPVIAEFRPDVVIVQGDTTTAFLGAQAAFYSQVPVAHLEAGLRSGDIYSPFPEEANRKLISVLSYVHLAPTDRAVRALHSEGISENVWKVGNTVIDSLLLVLEMLRQTDTDYSLEFPSIDFSRKIILITAHRRESFGEPLKNICAAVKVLSERHKELQIIWPVHPNPNVRSVVNSCLSDIANVHLIDPLVYWKLVWLMEKSYLILTDSGGIQEEAPVLGKPVLVMRDVTERMEGIEAGTARLVGSRTNDIVTLVSELIENRNDSYFRMANAVNPYGDGKSSQRIVSILKSLPVQI